MILGDRDSSSDASAAEAVQVQGDAIWPATPTAGATGAAGAAGTTGAGACAGTGAASGVRIGRDGACPPSMAPSWSAPIATQHCFIVPPSMTATHMASAPIELQAQQQAQQQQQFVPPARSSSGTFTLDGAARLRRVLPRTGSVNAIVSTAETRTAAGRPATAAASVGARGGGGAAAAAWSTGMSGSGGPLRQGQQPYGASLGHQAGGIGGGAVSSVPSAAWGVGSGTDRVRYGSGLQLQRSISANVTHTVQPKAVTAPHSGEYRGSGALRDASLQPVALNPAHPASRVRALHRSFSEAPDRHPPFLQAGHAAARHGAVASSSRAVTGSSSDAAAKGREMMARVVTWQNATAKSPHGGNHVLSGQVAVIGPSALNLRPLVLPTSTGRSVPLRASQSGDEQRGRATFGAADAAAASLPLSCRGVGGEGFARQDTSQKGSLGVVQQQELQWQGQASVQQQQQWQGRVQVRNQISGQRQGNSLHQQQQQHEQQQANNHNTASASVMLTQAVQTFRHPNPSQPLPPQQRPAGMQIRRQMSSGNQQMAGMLTVPGAQVGASGQSIQQANTESRQSMQLQQQQSLHFAANRFPVALSPASAHSACLQVPQPGTALPNSQPLEHAGSRKLQRSFSRPELLQQLSAELRQSRIVTRSASMSARRLVTTTAVDSCPSAANHKGSSITSVVIGSGSGSGSASASGLLMKMQSRARAVQSASSTGRGMQAGGGSSSVRTGGVSTAGRQSDNSTTSQESEANQSSGSGISSSRDNRSSGSIYFAASTSYATLASSRIGQSNQSGQSTEFPPRELHSFSKVQAVRTDSLQVPAAASARGVASQAQGASGAKVGAVGGMDAATGDASSGAGTAYTHRQSAVRYSQEQLVSQSAADSLAVRVGRRSVRDISKFPSDNKLPSPTDAAACEDRSHSCPPRKSFLPARRQVTSHPSPVRIPANQLPLVQPQTPSPGPHLASRLRKCSTSRPGEGDVAIEGGGMAHKQYCVDTANPGIRRAAGQEGRGRADGAQATSVPVVAEMAARSMHRGMSPHDRTESDGHELLRMQHTILLSPLQQQVPCYDRSQLVVDGGAVSIPKVASAHKLVAGLMVEGEMPHRHTQDRTC